jgi:transforming growth factor-beta-induced protein
MFKRLSVAFLMVTVLVFGSFGFAAAAPAPAMGPTIVDIAASNPNFSTLVSAVAKAGLVDALNGKGQQTVFAPTNAAFDNLAQASGLANGAALVEALDAETLRAVVLYHVAPGERFSGDVLASSRIRTQSKGFLFPYVDGGMAYLKNPKGVADAQIIAVDIEASNGVIHVIDQVLIP